MGDPDYETLIQAVVDAMMVIDHSGGICSVNAAAGRLFRCEEGELLGLRVEDLIPPRLRLSHLGLRTKYQAVPRPRLMGTGLETPGYRRDGSEFAAEVSLSPIPDKRTLVCILDITERRRTGEALRKFSRVVEQTASAIVITDRQGIIEYVNPSFEKCTGYSAEEVTGHRPGFLKSGHTSNDEYQLLWQTINNGGVWHGEFHNRRKDGSLFWESAIISPIRDEEGAITHFVAIKDDITVSKMGAEALRERETQLRIFIDHSPVALAMFDSEMNYLAVSKRWLMDHGLEGRDVVGLNHYKVFPETSHRWRAMHQRCLSGRVERMEEDRLDRGNGVTQWLRWEARPWMKASGTIGGIVIFTEDVSDRVRDRDAIAQSEERFRAAFEQAAVGMAHVALDGHWLRVNQKLCEVVGYSQEALMETTFQSITHPQDRASDLVQVRALLDKKIDHYTSEKRYIRQDGMPVWIRLTVSLAQERGGRPGYFIAVVENINDRKQAENALRRLRGEFEQVMAVQVATQTAAAIAHDLNQPLNAIASYTAAALRMLNTEKPNSALMRHALECAEVQAQRAGDVMRELMQFLYKGAPQIEPFDINSAVEEAIANVQARSEPGISFNTSLEPGLKFALASRMQIERVLVNLLSNSVEAMQSAGIDPKSITVDVSTTSLQSMAVITVHDSGPGLDTKTARKAFDPFFTTKSHGLGMGLAVSRALVQANGGQLWHDSSEEDGATFRFTLPLVG
ncbi:PAS domain S-box protein [Aquabacterium sp. CECT 9606]|uniref:PAS domain S-box protein n=1 Tax=Aquabacterium sp. CECT 9606 TaxID=2845822 RepID=UPI001E341790|nr:PAS domain S-box protein [Aquabacterium sp. CECT 9606]CAH0351747.1 Adaptive-response sensory-kinase SasA [Aquabacterium sp. CECT 9606]